jgi:hypothetical protein
MIEFEPELEELGQEYTANKRLIRDPDRFLVCKKRCDQCPFSKNQQIIPEERLEEIIEDLHKDPQNPFLCHKRLEENHVCRGFFDTQANLSVRFAKMLDKVEYVD